MILFQILVITQKLLTPGLYMHGGCVARDLLAEDFLCGVMGLPP